MPRHDRAYGHTIPRKSNGHGTSRKNPTVRAGKGKRR